MLLLKGFVKKLKTKDKKKKYVVAMVVVADDELLPYSEAMLADWSTDNNHPVMMAIRKTKKYKPEKPLPKEFQKALDQALSQTDLTTEIK